MSDAPFLRLKPPPLLVPSASPASFSLRAQAAFKPEAGPNPPYVLHSVQLPGGAGYLFAGSDDSLRTFSAQLEPVAVLPCTQKGITSLVRGTGEESTAVFVTARDGTVTGWDTRDLSKEAFKLKGRSGAPYLTCSQSSDLACLAVGTELFHYEATIELWDLRTMQLSTVYTEAHSDDLTSLSFHPSPALSHVLLSGSVDGLLNTYDIRVADEDDAILTTQQIGASVSKAGWVGLPGRQGEMSGAWVATTIETIQLWDVNESELVSSMGDIREVCLQPWRSDYLIHTIFNPQTSGICILTGTQRGDVAVLNVADPERWLLESVLPGVGGRTLGGKGHADIVRCAHVDLKNSTIVTGGEDGRVCLWSL